MEALDELERKRRHLMELLEQVESDDEEPSPKKSRCDTAQNVELLDDDTSGCNGSIQLSSAQHFESSDTRASHLPENDVISRQDDNNHEQPEEGTCPKSNVIADMAVEELLEEGLDNEVVDDDTKVWKTVLENIENDHFETLPEGWCRVTHGCGLPVYLHRPTRVCTMTRPYFIGPDSVRQHKVPLTAIPCLHQKRIDEKKEVEEKMRIQEQERSLDDFGSKLLEKLPAPAVSIEKFDDFKLEPSQLTEYAKSIFRFKNIQVSKFKNFRDKKQNKMDQKTQKSLKEVGLTQKEVDKVEGDGTTIIAPTGIALINIPTADTRFHKKNFVMNPTGKTSVAVLHEFVQRALKGRIGYDIDEPKIANAPYNVMAVLFIKKTIRIQVAGTVKEKLALLQEKERSSIPYIIDSVKCDEDAFVIGRGNGTSKRVGRMVAAEMALKILLPNLRFNDGHVASIMTENFDEKAYDAQAIGLFDTLSIEDPRVFDMCVKTGQPKPIALLKTACNRSMKLNGETPVQTNRMIDNQYTEVTLSVGSHTCSVTALGSKAGKQRAAQGILQQLHPELTSFASILRLYASAEERADRREAQKIHDEVVRLQSKGSRLEPNHAVIRKLKEEMTRLCAPKISRPPLTTTHDSIDS